MPKQISLRRKDKWNVKAATFLTDGLVEMVLIAAKPKSIVISIMTSLMSILSGAEKMAAKHG